MPVILATQEAEIRRIAVRSQYWQIVCETLSRKNSSQKRAGRMTEGVGRVQTPVPHTQKKTHGCKLYLFLELYMDSQTNGAF
jgi:hypothetical protein